MHDKSITAPVGYKAVAGWPGYFINILGDILSDRQGGELRRVKAHIATNGYWMTTLALPDGRRKHCTVHRLVLSTFVGPCPAGMEACHKNGIRADCRLDNLRWDTRAANMADRKRHGKCRFSSHPTLGEANTKAKLDPEKVREIRRLREAGESLSAIAARFGVTIGPIHAIAKGKTWKHV